MTTSTMGRTPPPRRKPKVEGTTKRKPKVTVTKLTEDAAMCIILQEEIAHMQAKLDMMTIVVDTLKTREKAREAAQKGRKPPHIRG